MKRNPPPPPSTIRTRVSLRIQKDQDVLDTLKGGVGEMTPAPSTSTSNTKEPT